MPSNIIVAGSGTAVLTRSVLVTGEPFPDKVPVVNDEPNTAKGVLAAKPIAARRRSFLTSRPPRNTPFAPGITEPALTAVVMVPVSSVNGLAQATVPRPRPGIQPKIEMELLAPGVESLTIPELARHCIAAGLAKLKIPEQLEIVESLPRNPMGKVLKHVLRAQLLPAT